MAKSFKIKSNQIARAIKSSGLKNKLKKKSDIPQAKEKAKSEEVDLISKENISTEGLVEETLAQPKVRARTRSAFEEEEVQKEKKQELQESESTKELEAKEMKNKDTEIQKITKCESIPEIKAEKKESTIETQLIPSSLSTEKSLPLPKVDKTKVEPSTPSLEEKKAADSTIKNIKKPEPLIQKKEAKLPPRSTLRTPMRNPLKATGPAIAPRPKLGPTGRHVRDLLLKPKPRPAPAPAPAPSASTKEPFKGRETTTTATPPRDDARERQGGKSRFKEFKDVKPKKAAPDRGFDSRDRRGLQADDEQRWRKKRKLKGSKHSLEDLTIRPTDLTLRLPVSVKDLAAQMKLKTSQLIQKLFMQGMIITLNDAIDDETTLLLLGEEFGVTIHIDTAEEDRIRITGKTIKEEISEIAPEKLITRAPIVAFMGHVDHGKTSLIDAIRESNLASGEAGAITQHIGAFRCHTAVGDITILDTPGHEAFSAMRARGAEATDIVVLVIAGDEGIRQQTDEALQHAKAAGVTIVIAINKCDKPNFDAETIYRQLSERDLLVEAWGGQTVTVNTSAVTKEGINTLLEMLALQAEVLELKADPTCRARGVVLESEMHKGLGAVATMLVQNGSLRQGDAVVFSNHWARIKTMMDEHGKMLEIAGPSTPVAITGISGVPTAGEDFIVVADEKEARSIAEARQSETRKKHLQSRSAISLENLLQAASDSTKKMLNIILRADVQGSLEALKVALLKIESDKVQLNIILTGVGEISESDVQLATSSKAIIIGFHTGVESHAEPLIRQHGVQVRTHNIIYHAVDEVRDLMTGLLDKIGEEENRGEAKVLATFKSSALGVIAGCIVTEGVIHRNHKIRILRNGKIVWTGSLSSLKRLQDDVREVKAGVECGIVLGSNHNVQVDDILQSYEIVYKSQNL